MSFKVIQITKINSGVFTFLDPTNVIYPVSPQVSVRPYTPEGGSLTLKIRATLYINSDVEKDPIVKSAVEDGNLLTIHFKHNTSETTPETCNIWYVELDYTSETVKNITQVLSFLQGTKKDDASELEDDLSRGTKTDTDPDGNF